MSSTETTTSSYTGLDPTTNAISWALVYLIAILWAAKLSDLHRSSPDFIHKVYLLKAAIFVLFCSFNVIKAILNIDIEIPMKITYYTALALHEYCFLYKFRLFRHLMRVEDQTMKIAFTFIGLVIVSLACGDLIHVEALYLVSGALVIVFSMLFEAVRVKQLLCVVREAGSTKDLAEQTRQCVLKAYSWLGVLFVAASGIVPSMILIPTRDEVTLMCGALSIFIASSSVMLYENIEAMLTMIAASNTGGVTGVTHAVVTSTGNVAS